MTISRFQLQQKLPDQSIMPGFIVVAEQNHVKSNEIFCEGVNKFFKPFGAKLVVYKDKIVRLGILEASKKDSLRKQFMLACGRHIVCIQGAFYDKAIIKAGDDCFAEMIIETYMKNPEYLNGYNGYYSGFIYSISTSELVVFSDGLGFEKTYYRHDGKSFIASNNLYSIVSNKYLSRKVSEYALAETLVYQYPTGKNTIEENTMLLGPSETIMLNDGDIMIKHREAYKLGSRSKQSVKDLIEKYDYHYNTLKQYVNEPIALYLSKGKDARILMVMLKRHKIPFKLYNFAYGTTGALDSCEAIQLASLDHRNISVIESYESSEELDIMLAMDSTYHTEWTSIADLAERDGIKYFTMGTAADAWSGKLSTFRKAWKIRKHSDLFHELFRAVSNKQDDSFNDSYPMLPSFQELECNFVSYCQTLKKDTIEDSELSWYLEYRVFRNTLSILHRCKYYGIPIHTPMDINILNTYLSLPINLIKTQAAQAKIAAMDNILSAIPTIEANLPLRIEKHIRSLVILSNNIKAMRNTREKYQTNNNVYTVQSGVLQEILSNSKVNISNKRLLQRTENTDKFLHVIFDVMPYRRTEHCEKRELSIDRK